MTKEINLLVPNSLFLTLETKAKGQGVSIEALCLSLLKGEKEEVLVDPVLYSSLANSELKSEIHKVLKSDLPKEEIKKRVKTLEVTITRFIK